MIQPEEGGSVYSILRKIVNSGNNHRRFVLDSFLWFTSRARKDDTALVKKVKAVPLQACSGPEVSRKLRFPDFLTTAQDGGKVVSLTHWPHYHQETLLVLISSRG
jgi:hypothetical protein